MADFALINERVTLEAAAQMLGLQLKPSGKSLRSQCPACQGSDRALVVTPGKGFYCWDSHANGKSVVSFVAHVMQVEMVDAGKRLEEHFGIGIKPTVPQKPEGGTASKAQPSSTFSELDYLDPDHDAVEAVGFDPDIARQLGIGFAPRGVLRGTVAIPLRLPDGTLTGYAGITEAKLPAKWHGLTTNVVPLKRPA